MIMAVVETALVKVGSAAANFALRSWAGKRRAERQRSSELIEQLADGGLNLFANRKLERQFERLADRIAEDLRPLVENEFQAMPLNERIAALNAVTDALDETDFSDQVILE